MIENICLVIGILCLLYFLCIAFFVGHGTNFYFVWFLAGIFFIGIYIGFLSGILPIALPKWLSRILIMLFSLAAAFFMFAEGCIISGFFEKGVDNLDYIIVLGAQMKIDGPSRILKMRLDSACEYLIKNEKTKVVVSGGQGRDEHISEAQGMYEYLIAKGIAKDRIIQEDQSKNTHQNLIYSSTFLDKEKDTVGIVSNDFHIFRAVKLAKRAGYTQVYGIAAKSDPFLEANNMVREFLGLTKDFLMGNL